MRILVLIIILISGICIAQNDNIFPVTINEIIPELTLTKNNGSQVNINNLNTENILLVFPRGKVTETTWCPICHYQYLEMVKIEKKYDLRKKYNMEIFFVLPCSPDSLQSWIDAIPNSLQAIENWKNPTGENSENQNVITWAEYAKEFFPITFKYDENNFQLDLPFLFDPDHKVSEGLMIFRQEWGGTKVEQNVPTIFLIDKDRKVKFKYFSQYTNDRISAEFLADYLEYIY
jgi:peroxiredoxin